MRRASFGWLKNCSPASCLPEKMSHSRNSAFSLPSALPMRPTTRACALSTRQSSKDGTASGDTVFSMKAAWSMGANNPEVRRSLATTSEISRAVAASTVPSPTKSGMAMGSAWILPCVMLSSTTAKAGAASKKRATDQPSRHNRGDNAARREFVGQDGSLYGRWHVIRSCYPLRYMSLGSKLRIMSRHSAYLSLGSS